jgi:hypothetical protein
VAKGCFRHGFHLVFERGLYTLTRKNLVNSKLFIKFAVGLVALTVAGIANIEFSQSATVGTTYYDNASILCVPKPAGCTATFSAVPTAKIVTARGLSCTFDFTSASATVRPFRSATVEVLLSTNAVLASRYVSAAEIDTVAKVINVELFSPAKGIVIPSLGRLKVSLNNIVNFPVSGKCSLIGDISP